MLGRFAVVTAALAVAFVPRLWAQGVPAPASSPAGSAIVEVTGSADTLLAADRATLTIAVETHASTAASAGAENAKVQQAVLAALRQAGVEAGQITSSGYVVEPEWRTNQNESGKPSGYAAHNTVQVELSRLDRIGAVIDAALGAGANRIDNVAFTASSTTGARRAMLAAALANARADADAIARAAGGTLGRLIEASTEPFRPIPVAYDVMQASRSNAPTPIEPRSVPVTATVVTRWRLDLP